MSSEEVTVLRFGGRRVPRSLRDLPVGDVRAPSDVDPTLGMRRALVLGTHADLATVLTRLLRTDRLDVEVGLVRRGWTARRARTAPARRVPLIRDETGSVITGAALWLPVDAAAAIEGEAVVDDTTLFSGAAAGVRIEPLPTAPGLRARVLDTGVRRRWVTGRAAQLGTVDAVVVRDGVADSRAVRRSTFYRHTHGWLAVR